MITNPGGHIKCPTCEAVPIPMDNEVRCTGTADMTAAGRSAQLFKCARCGTNFIHEPATDQNTTVELATKQGWRVDTLTCP
jgi:hypothetical protein